MTWISDPALAFESAAWTLMILSCKVGVWLIWPIMTLSLHYYRR